MDADWATTRLRRIDSLTTLYRGPKYLSALVLCLNRVLGVRYSLIAERLQLPATEPTKARTIVFADAQNLAQPFIYDVAGLPCASVLEGKAVSVLCDLGATYPQAGEMAAYCGHPLCAADGRVIGVLAIEHSEALNNHDQIEDVIRMLSGRVAAELECEQLRRP